MKTFTEEELAELREAEERAQQMGATVYGGFQPRTVEAKKPLAGIWQRVFVALGWAK